AELAGGLGGAHRRPGEQREQPEPQRMGEDAQAAHGLVRCAGRRTVPAVLVVPAGTARGLVGIGHDRDPGGPDTNYQRVIWGLGCGAGKAPRPPSFSHQRLRTLGRDQEPEALPPAAQRSSGASAEAASAMPSRAATSSTATAPKTR